MKVLANITSNGILSLTYETQLGFRELPSQKLIQSRKIPTEVTNIYRNILRIQVTPRGVSKILPNNYDGAFLQK